MASRVCVVPALAVALSSTALAAGASNFGSTNGCGYETGNSGYNPPTNCVSLANNSVHAVRLEVVGNQWAGMDTAVINALSTDYNPTDLSAYVDQSDPLPDVLVYDLDYGGGFPPAWADCPADNTSNTGSNPTRRCRGQKVRFNGSWEASYVNTASTREGLACHELGHTVGLRHSTSGEWNSCMEGMPHQNTSGLFYRHDVLHDHDKQHINATY
jgi:hypothetical protein